MSDEEYVKPILYLPYEVFLEIAEAGSRPEGLRCFPSGCFHRVSQ